MSKSPARPSRWLKPLLAVAGALALIAWLGGPAIQRALTLRLFLGQPAPDTTGVYEWLDELPNPTPAVLALWQQGRMAHRYLAAYFTKNHTADLDPAAAETLLLEAAQDADLGVRELALSALARDHHPALPALAERMLADLDPEARQLGLHYLSRQEDPALAPRFIALLDDPSPTIRALAAAALRRIADQDFGVRVRDTIPGEKEQPLEPEKAARVAAGIARWKAWWQTHQTAWLAAHPAPATRTEIAVPPRPAPPVADFALTDVEGRTVRLSDFRGKAVWLNFWSTWCTACVGEIPLLNELQARYGDELVVLGISLDGVPDEHGHVPGESHAHEAGAGPEQAPAGVAGRAEAHETPAPSVPEETLAKVKRAVHRRSIRYRVLLDPHNEVGSRFNGGQLPTQVLIAPDGRVTRRFIGPRPLDTFIQMVDEALGKKSGLAGPTRTTATPAKTTLAKE